MEPNEAMKAMVEMAKRIGERNTGTFTVHPERGVRQLDEETVALIRQTATNAALAAIMETQARTDGMREALERIASMTPNSANARTAQDLCLTVRAIAETALAGER